LGTKGAGYDNIHNLGSIAGSYGTRDFFEFAGPRYAGAHTIGNDTFESFAGFSATELMEGKDTITGSIHWKVVGVGGDLKKSDFTNGVMSGIVKFAAGQTIGGLGFSFKSGFMPTKRETFNIELYSPSGGDGLGENDILTETLIPIAKGNQTINGANGNDDIACGPGKDVVNGLGGAATIYCGSGRDTINCDSGDDSVTAGTGVDTLVGGSGQDTFTFFLNDSKPSAPDTIEGFNHALGDKIAIAGASKYVGVKNFDGLANEIRAVENSALNETIVSYATTGEKTASIEIIVKGLHNFVAGDFGLP
jgi:Ca2+-binding RTX toxin-like protein